MKNPFQYGKIAEAENFIDRDEDRAFLKQSLFSGTNVILMSPRRWGKSSLVKRAMGELCGEQTNVRVCHIDAFPVTSSAAVIKNKRQLVMNDIIITATKPSCEFVDPIFRLWFQRNYCH